MSDNAQLTGLCDRFRGFYPVVIDVETAGFNAKTDALLEIAAITLKMDEQGWLMPDTTLHFHVEPFVGANLQPEALAFNGIDPNDPDRGAVSEYEALHEIFKVVRKGIKASGCNRAIMVAHNANFDHSFMMAATSPVIITSRIYWRWGFPPGSGRKTRVKSHGCSYPALSSSLDVELNVSVLTSTMPASGMRTVCFHPRWRRCWRDSGKTCLL